LGKIIIIDFKMKKMKSILKYLLIGVLFIQFVSCEEDLLDKEHYKKIIYLKSGDNNIFSHPHKMNDSLTTGYITVGSGGSMPLDKDALIELVTDDEAIEKLNSYNYRYFGNDLGKYAQLLSSKRYVLPSYDIILKAGDLSATTFIPIEADVNGLSPDTSYMIPFRIKSTGEYEVNTEKDFVLYKIDLENAYSSSKLRSYKMRGTKQLEDEEPSNITTNKDLLPLARNQVRLFPENINSSTNLETINGSTIVLIVNDDNSVEIKPYKSIEVEQIGECIYNPEEKLFTINYKYRRPKESKWTIVHERLTRIE